MSNSRIVLFAFGLVAAGVLVVVISMREKRRLD
jgi:tetrahydromethanopterin S-methyltransferase subunit F